MSDSDWSDSDEGEFSLGHNTENASALREYVARIERLENEKAETAEDIRAVYAEAKQRGFDPSIMRAIVKIKRADQEKRKKFESALALYKHAMGIE